MLMRNRGPVFAADAEGGAAAPAADTPAPAAAAPDANSVLYPDDKPAAAEDAPAWAEFVPDPSKSDDENADAKAEHDASKPADVVVAVADDEVPPDGKYNFTMPEGVELDGELAAAIGPELAAAKVTQADAQKLADKFTAILQARATKQAEAWTETTSGWVDTAKADPEIGGAKWDKTVSTASGLVKRFGNDGLKDFLNASGAGNHPEMIRFMAKVGALIGEDNPAHSEAPGKTVAVDVVSKLYPDDKPKGK